MVHGAGQMNDREFWEHYRRFTPNGQDNQAYKNRNGYKPGLYRHGDRCK